MATQLQITKLEAAIMSGVMTVEHDGHRTTFQNLTEMRAALAAAKAELAAETSGSRTRVATTCKGL